MRELYRINDLVCRFGILFAGLLEYIKRCNVNVSERFYLGMKLHVVTLLQF